MGRRLNPVDRYAKQVVAGKIPAGKYHRLACVRHLRDRARENTPGFPFVFVWETRNDAGRLGPCAVRFLAFARRMRHYKGKQWAGKLFDPSPSQVFRLGSLFGWRRVGTGRRRFTTAYNELPRKHGKSFEGAIVLVYVTFFEGEAGAEGYVIATKRAQALIVFGDARRLVLRSRVGSKRLSEIVVNATSLYLERTASRVQPLGADSDSTDGLNPNCTVADELHAYKNRGLLDVMESGTGARDNPLMYQITTAGDRLESPGGDQHAVRLCDSRRVDRGRRDGIVFRVYRPCGPGGRLAVGDDMAEGNAPLRRIRQPRRGSETCAQGEKHSRGEGGVPTKTSELVDRDVVAVSRRRTLAGRTVVDLDRGGHGSRTVFYRNRPRVPPRFLRPVDRVPADAWASRVAGPPTYLDAGGDARRTGA